SFQRHTTPPAWSSRPETGFIFTSTTPSASAASFTHHGNVPRPDCFRTLGALGAVASRSTDQRGAPVPVTPAFQPSGSAPAADESKLTTLRRAAAMLAVSMDPPGAKPLRRLDGTPSWEAGEAFDS